MKVGLSRYTLIALPIVLGLAPMPLLGADNAAGSVTVTDPYVRAVPPGQKSSAAFMKLNNAGDADHALVSAGSSAAKIVELHTHVKEGGMMKMRQIERIDIPGRGETVLEPGGLHVMLINLNQELKDGDNVSVILVFQDGSKKEVRAPVRKIRTKMQHMH